MKTLRPAVIAFVLALAAFTQPARADTVTEWNEIACAISGKAGGGATGHRLMANIQVAVFDAVSAIEKRGKPYMGPLDAPAGASVEAAVAAANRMTLETLVPAEKATVEAAYQAAIARIAEGPAKSDGIRTGELAAARVLARAEKDLHNAPDTYQPHTTAGIYVPTMIPVFASWPKRTPWVLSKPDQFRPGPPPSLDSETWARDLQEVKALGAKTGSQRTKEQTDIAQFWEETRPLLYHGVVRSVANMPGRSVYDNARLLGAAAVAADDALIAVFDAKYAYNFWRPVTAIRNGHMATKGGKAEPGWTPFINTPMHPEYPCAHCVTSGAIGAVLQAELGNTSGFKLVAKSPTSNDAVREWTTVAAFMEEVQMARIYDGVHYRNSGAVGNDLGQKVGALAMQKFGR
jgi:hypothetical protein